MVCSDTEKNGDIPYTNGDTVKKDSDLDADSTTQVELVDDNQGPKTAAQKALEEVCHVRLVCSFLCCRSRQAYDMMSLHFVTLRQLHSFYLLMLCCSS